MTTSTRTYHRGLGVHLWTSRGTWFWQLAGRCGIETIGVASTENGALCEARAAAEEMLARCAQAVPATVSAAPSVIGGRQRSLAKLNFGDGGSANKLAHTRGES